MSACDFVVASCSSTEIHMVPRLAASGIIRSPSLPDVNDSSLQEVIGTVLASWCPSFSHAFRKHFAQGQKFRSPISLALMVLKAQFLALKRRVYALVVENGSLRLANGALQSRIASSSEDLSRLRADYNTLLCDRKALTRAAEQDQQRIRTLTSDIDNAQQFIMAMVDIKLHESFLHAAANETVVNGEDAEKSLAKAIAQEADRVGSLWSRILAYVVDIHCANSFSAAVDLALQAKAPHRGDGSMKDANLLPPPSEPGSVYQVTLGDRPSCPFSSARDSRNPSASPPETRVRPPPLSVPRQSPTSPFYRLSPTKISGLGIQYHREIFPPPRFTAQTSKMSRTRPDLTPRIEDVKLKSTRTGTACKKAVRLSETQKQSHTKNLDKRKGMIITNDIAKSSISQNKVEVKETTTLFTALTSLERICTLLSSSDLGSLEETSDDDESRSRASYESEGFLDLDKRDLTETFGVICRDDDSKVIKANGTTDRKVEEALGTPILSDAEFTEEDQPSRPCLVSDCPELSPSMSTSPPSTPLGLAWSFSSERSLGADSSPTSTEFSDTIFTVKPDLAILYEDSATIRSLPNVSKFPMVSGIAKRLSRVITKAENNNGASNACGSPTSTTTKLINSSPKTSASKSNTILSPARQLLSSKSTRPSKKTATLGKTPRSTAPDASEAPAGSPSAKHAKGIAGLKCWAEGKPTSAQQESKFSVGRNFLRRLSNIPGTVSRTRFVPTMESSKSPGARPNQTPILLSPPTPALAKPRSQTAVNTSPKPKASPPKPPMSTTVNDTTVTSRASIDAVISRRTKPRSNTVNGYSPVKPSPLSKNVVTALSGRPDSSSSWKRQSVQVIISTSTKVAPTTRGARTSDPDPTVLYAATPPRLAEKKLSTKRQGVKTGKCEPTAATPTAAFMKPVNKSATKVAKRMTNSIKPLIPTWTAGPSSSSSQCGNMFRNSLSMVVR